MRFVLLFFFLISSVAHAAGLDALRSFLTQTTAAKAHFAQTVMDSDLKVVQEASGTMQFSRPGKFRWEYQKPYEQVIVGDGARLWIFDKDLNQVTTRPLDRALGASPAALLAGSNEIEQNYNLSDISGQDGLQWVEAIPKARDTAFERIRLGFGKGNGLEVMELRDQFGQVTVIRFSNLVRNPAFPEGAFRFVPPPGADIIRE